MCYKKGFGLGFLFTIISFVGLAQLPNRNFSDVLLNDTSHKAGLQFELPTQFFVRNTEYFNPIADGRTLFGFQLNPRLSYALADNLILKGGIFAQRNFGEDNSTLRSQLTFSLVWRANAENTLVFGNLNGALGHNFIEPLYHFENQFERPMEEVLQWLHNSKFFETDTYIDWQRFTFPQANVKERFTFGSSSKLKAINNSPYEVNFPFQFTAVHSGGTLDTLSGTGATMWWHFAPGIELIEKIDEQHSYELSAYLIKSTITAGLDNEPFKDGFALYMNIFFRNKYLPVMLSYFDGVDYAGVLGTPLMFSRSSKARDVEVFTERRRQLLFLRFLKDFKLAKNSDYMASLRFEPYYDIVNKRAELSMGFYVHLPVRKAIKW